MNTFKHSGKLGDVIYSLPTIRALGGGKLFLNVGSDGWLTEQSVENLAPLLRLQEYIDSVEIWRGEEITYDLDIFRIQKRLDCTNLASAHLTAFGQQTSERNLAWLSLDARPPQHGRPVFARSLTRTPLPGFWEAAVGRFPNPIFVGSEEEHLEFCRSFGKIEYAVTGDMLPLAHLLNGASVVVANQSAPYAIAEGLKLDTVQEVDTWAPNCVFSRPNAFYASAARHLDQMRGDDEILGNGQTIGIATQPNIELGPHVGKLSEPTLAGSSVIVLTYNSLETIQACLESVVATLAVDDELIVVDNASTDGTREWLTTFGERAKTQVILNDNNQGFSAGCNRGLLVARGRFLVLLNPDTEVYPGWLNKLADRFVDPDVAAVGPLSNHVAGNQFVGLHVDLNQRTPSMAELGAEVEQLHAGRSMESKLIMGLCVMFCQDIINRTGMLDEGMYLGSEDLEISWRLRSLGYTLLIARDVFVYHRGGKSFESIPQSRINCVLNESSAALRQKLHRSYRPNANVSSSELWDIAFMELSRE